MKTVSNATIAVLVLVAAGAGVLGAESFLLRALQGKFPGMTSRIVKDAGHQLLNERQDLLEQVLDATSESLKRPD